jgi:hypothetical protein
MADKNFAILSASLQVGDSPGERGGGGSFRHWISQVC